MVYYNALNTILLHKLIIGTFGGGDGTKKHHVIGWEPGEPLMDLTSVSFTGPRGGAVLPVPLPLLPFLGKLRNSRLS